MKDIKELIKSKPESLSQIAKNSGVSRQSIYNVMKGKQLSNTTLKLLCRYFNVDYKDYLED